MPLADAVETCFGCGVMPHVPDAWIDIGKCEPRDGQAGFVDYEIGFNRYFSRSTQSAW